MGPLSLQWTSPARFDLRRLQAWAERYRGPEEARKLAQRLREAVERLSVYPRLGRRVPLPDNGSEELRELVVSPFVIRYAITPDRLVVLRIWHGRERH